MGEEIRKAEAFAEEMAGAYGDELVSVVLYGSAARGDYREGISDLNVLVLLREVTPAALRRGSAVARRWVEGGDPPPLLLGVEEWRRSTDVFPIEQSDIRDAHRVLRGADPFAGVAVDRAHLRLQCENELKGKQIRLRERYLLSSGEPEELEALLKHSISTFLVLFRTVLRLAGEEPPRDPTEAVRRTAARVGFDAEPLLRILHARRTDEALRPAADAPEVVGYLEAVARTVEYVDRLPVEP